MQRGALTARPCRAAARLVARAASRVKEDCREVEGQDEETLYKGQSTLQPGDGAEDVIVNWVINTPLIDYSVQTFEMTGGADNQTGAQNSE